MNTHLLLVLFLLTLRLKLNYTHNLTTNKKHTKYSLVHHKLDGYLKQNNHGEEKQLFVI